MNTIILRTATFFLMPLLLLFSLFILLRGHYYPGGGFVGGLIAAIAFVLYAFSFGLSKAAKLLRFNPRMIMAVGAAIAAISAVIPLLLGKAFMTGLWLAGQFPVLGNVGLALAFDTGVYLVVIGATLTILLTVSESV